MANTKITNPDKVEYWDGTAWYGITYEADVQGLPRCSYYQDTNTSNLTLYLDGGNLSSYPGSGTTWNDLSGNNNNATVVAAGFNPTSVTELGNFGTMNSYSPRPYVASNTDLDLSTSFTLSCWFKSNGTGAGGIVNKRNSGPDYGYELTKTGTQLQFIFYSYNAASQGYVFYDMSSLQGAWTQAIVTYDGANLRLYVNGSNVNTQAQTATPSANTGPLYIGQKYNHLNITAFNGWVQEVKIWNVVLSPTEATAEFDRKKACFGL